MSLLDRNPLPIRKDPSFMSRFLNHTALTILLIVSGMSIDTPCMGFQDENGHPSSWFPVFPKHEGLMIEQSDEDKRNTEPQDFPYPDGKSPILFASGMEGGNYRIAHPKVGIVKSSDCHSFTDILKIDFNEVMRSEDDWLKFIFARALQEKKDFVRSYRVLKSIAPGFKDTFEFRFLMTSVKMDLKLYDSALLELIPIIATERDPLRPATSRPRVDRAIILIDRGKYEDALRDLETGYEITRLNTADIGFFRAVCNYKLGYFDIVIENLNEDTPETAHFYLLDKLWVGCRSLVRSDGKFYDRALRHLDSSKFAKSSVEFLARLDASFIHSCRTDTERRNGNRAMEILESLREHRDFDIFVNDFMMAEVLANIELGNFDRASDIFRKLKFIVGSGEDYPDLNIIESAIMKRIKYLPAKHIPLSREKHVH